MGALPAAASSSVPLSNASHLPALRRAAAIAVVGFAVWAAAIASSWNRVKQPPDEFQVNAPEWTYRGSTSAYRLKSTHVYVQSSCTSD